MKPLSLLLLDNARHGDKPFDGESGHDAVRSRQVAGHAACSPRPTPRLQELATRTPVRVLSMTPERIAAMNTKIHPGARRWSRENGAIVPAAMQ